MIDMEVSELRCSKEDSNASIKQKHGTRGCSEDRSGLFGFCGSYASGVKRPLQEATLKGPIHRSLTTQFLEFMVSRTLSFRRKPPVQRSLSSERPLISLPSRTASSRRALRRSASSSFDSVVSDDGHSISSSNEPQPQDQFRKSRRVRKAPSRNSSFQLSFRNTLSDSLHGSSHSSLKLNDSCNNIPPGTVVINVPKPSRNYLYVMVSLIIAGLCVVSLYVQASMYSRVQVVKRSAHQTDTTPRQTSNSTKQNTLRQKSESMAAGFNFEHNKRLLEAHAQEFGSIVRPITAFIESPLNDTIPGTFSRENPDDKNYGTEPEFIRPLPLRTQSPQDLRKIVYPTAKSCHDIPHKLPVDRGLQFDNETGELVTWNIGSKPLPKDYAEQEGKYCPVELDPFLPWIHDMFTSPDGSFVEFVAQNRRRCHTGVNHTDSVKRLVPQPALLQAVSVQRIDQSEAAKLAPTVWRSGSNTSVPRYRLASLEEADSDAAETRFICRFRGTVIDEVTARPTTRILGETLSRYPFNYEYISYRKGIRGLLTPQGKDAGFFWTSTLRFRCPIPQGLQQAIVDGQTILQDGTTTVSVDVVPIRTSVRYNEVHFPKDYVRTLRKMKFFDPVTGWGRHNVIPEVEASGRWENLPVCPPPEPVNGAGQPVEVVTAAKKPQKLHTLSACLWSSAIFKGRGDSNKLNTDTMKRIQEWIEFHLMVGFDHIYVYDNSGAHSNDTSLEPLLSQYSEVTRIDWPSTVCSNNKPTADSPGERSSQYAAEASCLARYGPYTEWIASFDTDEYFVPMGNYTDVRDVLSDVKKQGTKILSLKSSRGKLRYDMAVPAERKGIERDPSKLFLEAYNCDSASIPKPEWANRALKQVYMTDYVLHHFVHYSTATRGTVETFADSKETGVNWEQRYVDKPPIAAFSDEKNEIVMVHAKSISAENTLQYEKNCRPDSKRRQTSCLVGFPWPNGLYNKTNMGNDDGFGYNCFVNDRVETFWLPKLKEALAQRRETDDKKG